MTEQQRLRTPGPTAGSDTRDDLPDPSLRSVGEVLGDITTDLSTLLRQEVEPAKAELKETAEHAKAAGGMFAGAASRPTSRSSSSRSPCGGRWGTPWTAWAGRR